ncbi:hypothetical protein DFH09DRAFT_1292022 [Mycena vulgaris]|nr:hypothetical protein DFH09DRAFT_1292022 [Mycena vulgaris]
MEAKLKTPTCSRCKLRKIRCDGLSTCNTCSTAGARCKYEEDFKDVLELRKGAACLACRRKKKKCDGKFPCHTCASSRKKIPCEYPDGIVVTLPLEKSDGNVVQTGIYPADSGSSDSSSIPDAIGSTGPFTASAGTSAASGSSNGSPAIPLDILNFPDAPTDIYDIQSPSPFTLPGLSVSQPTPSIILAELTQARDIFLQDAVKLGMKLADKPIVQNDDRMDVELSSQTDDLHAPVFQMPAPTADSNDGDELAQIRTLFLNHRVQMGLSVTDGLLQALANGAAPTGVGDCLHPVLLHACQLMGYMLARHLKRNTWLHLPGQSEREAEQTRLTLAALQDLRVAACPLAYLQTASLLTLYFFSKDDIARSRGILRKAGELVRDHHLDAAMLAAEAPAGADTSTDAKQTGFKARVTTKATEAQAVLAHLVYLDVAFTIILKLPSIIDPQLLENFKDLISRPNLHAEINFVRAKSAFLLLEAEKLAAQWHQSDMPADKAAEWQEDYWALMEALDAHRSFLTLTLTRIAFCPELRTVGLTLKMCTVLVLAGLSVLLTLFGQQAELRRKKLEAVAEIISISETFTEEDCEYLDPILSTSWSIIIGTLNECIALGPEVVARSLSNLPAMVNVIRERNKTLQRVLPFAVDV